MDMAAAVSILNAKKEEMAQAVSFLLQNSNSKEVVMIGK